MICRVLTWIPRRVVGIVLDTLLGPAEDFDYVSVTTPKSPPTTP